MKIAEVVSFLESQADPSLQEGYDNAGLLTGNAAWDCTGILCCLDSTEEVVSEAIEKKCNLIIAHHPIIFGGLKKINGKNYVERTVIRAIRNDIAIYAIHTNLDNVLNGVNGRMAGRLALQNVRILMEKEHTLKKLYVFVPADHASAVRQAIFDAGGGHIGNYSECSFNTNGTGTFKAGDNASPFTGEKNRLHEESEVRLEVVFPVHLQSVLVAAMKEVHPYEEVAYDVVALSNSHPERGAGLIGELPEPMDEAGFLRHLASAFQVSVIRHTRLLDKPVRKVALCGGAGSFLINKALARGADFFVSADIKYHEFFDANDRLVIADIGHYESEQFTVDLLREILLQKFPNFAVLKTGVMTNPVRYFCS